MFYKFKKESIIFTAIFETHFQTYAMYQVKLKIDETVIIKYIFKNGKLQNKLILKFFDILHYI